MIDFKDLYIQAVEERMAELEEAGMNTDAAYDLASNDAYRRAQDLLADHADFLRKRAREEGQ